MRMQVQVKGVQGVVRTMGRLQRWASIESPKLTFDQAEEGKRIAFNLAPKRTHALVNAIATTGGKGKGFSVVSRMPKNQRRLDGVPRPYHFFMHGMKTNGFPYYDTSRKIRSGDPRYMNTTYNLLSKKFPEKISKSLDKTIKQK